MSSITEKARAKAEEVWPTIGADHEVLAYPRSAIRSTARDSFEAGAEFGYAERVAESLSVEQVADIVDQHRISSAPDFVTGKTYFGCGCRLWHRVALTEASVQSAHAAHVAAMIHAGNLR